MRKRFRNERFGYLSSVDFARGNDTLPCSTRSYFYREPWEWPYPFSHYIYGPMDADVVHQIVRHFVALGGGPSVVYRDRADVSGYIVTLSWPGRAQYDWMSVIEIRVAAADESPPRTGATTPVPQKATIYIFSWNQSRSECSPNRHLFHGKEVSLADLAANPHLGWLASSLW